MRTQTWAVLPLAMMLTTGCGPDFEARMAGSVDGKSFEILTAYWGGPFIVLTGDELDCIDLAFISKFTEDGDEPLVDFDVSIFQITYNDSLVVDGNYNFGGEAPVTAEYIEIEGGAMSVYRATEGTLVVENAVEEESITGEFAVSFNENGDDLGALTGDFTMPWCTNLTSRY